MIVTYTLKVYGIYLDVRFFLALFNSKLLNFYYRAVFASTKKIFSEIGARQVAQLPVKNINLSIPKDKQRYDFLVSSVDEITNLTGKLQKLSPNTDEYNRLKKEIEKLDHQIDKEIYKLYALTNEEIATIEE